MKRVIFGAIALCLTTAVIAGSYERTCHACDPGDSSDHQVQDILDEYGSQPTGTQVTIQDDRLEQGRYYYYVTWEKQGNTFNIKERGDRQLAEAGGGGGYNGTPGSNIPNGNGGNYGGGCIGNCGPVNPHVVVGPITNP